ncbi:MAG: hypothetical protein HRU20_29635 [Pseudomonadales bacterium]|nr:hypothetical protein [Pseudomonadales bacterium]
MLSASEIKELLSRIFDLELKEVDQKNELKKTKQKLKDLHSENKILKIDAQKYNGPQLKSQLSDTKKKLKTQITIADQQKKKYALKLKELECRVKGCKNTIQVLMTQNKILLSETDEMPPGTIYDYVSDDEKYAVLSTKFIGKIDPPTNGELNYRVMNLDSGASGIARYKDNKVSFTEFGEPPGDISLYIKVAIEVSNLDKTA